MHSQIVCRGCRTLLLYPTGAACVQCFACSTVTVTPVYPDQENSTSLVNCGHCRITLMFPRGARSVRCSRCDFVTNIITASTQANNMTVVVENPMTLDEKGKLVSNDVAVGIASDQTAVIDPNRSHTQFFFTAPMLLVASVVRTLGLRI